MNQSNNMKLRAILLNDFKTILKWSQNDIFCRANGWELNGDKEEFYIWWESLVNCPPEGFFRLGIERNGQLIGYTDLASIKEDAAELGIAIGNPRFWGKGLGSQAAELMIEYGRKELGVKIFLAETHETNTRSRKMLERIGFKEVSKEGAEIYLGEDTKLVQYALQR